MLLGSYYLSIEPFYCINICININFVNYKKYPSVRWHQYRNTDKENASDNTELYTERQTDIYTDKTPAEQNIYTKYYQNNHFVFFPSESNEGLNVHRDWRLTSAAYSRQIGRFPAAGRTAPHRRWGDLSAARRSPCYWSELRWTRQERTAAGTPARKTLWGEVKNINIQK